MIPNLRFPEYESTWKRDKLGSLVFIITDYVASGSFASLRENVRVLEKPEEGSAIYVRLTDLRLGLKGSLKFVDQESYRFLSKSNLHGGELLMANIGANVGDVYLMPKIQRPATIAPNMLVIRENKEILLNSFLYQFLKGRGGNEVQKLISGSGQPKLSKTDLKSAIITFPKLDEQIKIANLFSLLDQKINLLTKRKEALETYKKGLMRKIFSQEYWNQGFMILSQICKIYDGTHQTPKYVDEGVSFYSVEHVSKDDFSKTKFVTEEVFVKECQRVSIEQGDILMTRIGSVGVPKFIDWNVRASFYVSLALLKPKIEGINMGWLSYYIQSSDIQREIWRLTIHVAFPKKINLGDIGKIRVKLPSKAVQESNYILLKSLDQKINFITKKIKASEELKKGLLQQMFV